jgi:hypothetical protein
MPCSCCGTAEPCWCGPSSAPTSHCYSTVVGAAVRGLAELELIHRAGLSRSVRPEAHGRDLPLWAVSDRTAALAWLAAHHELPDPAELSPGPLWDW